MPRVPRPDELPRAALQPANEPPTINPNVASRIGQAGRSMGNAIEAVGGAFGEVFGRIGQAQNADNYARAKLETLKGYQGVDDDIGANAGEDGQLWTTAPDRYKAVHDDIDKRYPISNPNRKREFDTWRESQAYTRGKRAALTYQDAQRSQFVRGYDADLQGFEDRVARGEVDPETFNQTHDALRERLYGLNRTVMAEAEVQQRARQLQGRLAGALDRYLATKDPAERERFWDQVRKGRYELDEQVPGRGAPLASVDLTAYAPQSGGDRMQGGYAAARPGPDGKAEVRTLDDVASGRSAYVTVAGDPSLYGRSYMIPKIDYIDAAGNRKTLENVRAVVHDTGSAFKGKPEGRFDIAVARDVNERTRNANHAAWKQSGVQFIPERGSVAPGAKPENQGASTRYVPPGTPGVVAAITDQPERRFTARGYGDRVTGKITVNGRTYEFVNGGTGRGSIPLGEYTVGRFTPGEQRAREGFQYRKDAFELNDVRDDAPGTKGQDKRRGLLIHDGNAGVTAGCIGIKGDFQQFRKDMQAEIARNGGKGVKVQLGTPDRFEAAKSANDNGSTRVAANTNRPVANDAGPAVSAPEAPAADAPDTPAPVAEEATFATRLADADPDAPLSDVLSDEDMKTLSERLPSTGEVQDIGAMTVREARELVDKEPGAASPAGRSGEIIPPARPGAPRPDLIPMGRLSPGQVFEVRTPRGTIQVPGEWLNAIPAQTRAARSKQAAEAYRVFERERQVAADKSMKDGEAHIGSFGTLPPGYDAEAIKQAYGRDPKKIADHVRRMRLAKGVHDALADAVNLPDDEVIARLEALRPNEGEPDAAERTAIVAQAEKRITALLAKREKDPGGSVEQSREVRAAREKLVGGAPRNVHDRGALADARLQAQARVEIPEAVRSPISVDEARALGAGLRASNIGTATAEIEKLYKRAEGEWGKRHAEGVLRSVIRTQIRDQRRRETYDAMLTGFIEDQDRPPPPEKPAAGPSLMERAWQMVPSRRAVGDFFGGMDLGLGDSLPPDAAARGPATNPEAAPEPVYPKPNAKQVQHLKSNPALVEQFDAKFGPGAAEKALPGVRRSLLLQGAQ